MDLDELDRLIASSYGIEDLIFAGHSLDVERASKSLVKANEKGIGMKEYLDRHRSFLTKKNCSEKHINEQLKRVQKLEYYIKFD